MSSVQSTLQPLLKATTVGVANLQEHVVCVERGVTPADFASLSVYHSTYWATKCLVGMVSSAL